MTLNSDMTWSGPSEYRDSILLSPSTRSQSQCHLPVKLLAIPVENVYDSHSDPPRGWPEESSIDLYARLGRPYGGDHDRLSFFIPVWEFWLTRSSC